MDYIILIRNHRHELENQFVSVYYCDDALYANMGLSTVYIDEYTSTQTISKEIITDYVKKWCEENCYGFVGIARRI